MVSSVIYYLCSSRKTQLGRDEGIHRTGCGAPHNKGDRGGTNIPRPGSQRSRRRKGAAESPGEASPGQDSAAKHIRPRTGASITRTSDVLRHQNAVTTIGTTWLAVIAVEVGMVSFQHSGRELPAFILSVLAFVGRAPNPPSAVSDSTDWV